MLKIWKDKSQKRENVRDSDIFSQIPVSHLYNRVSKESDLIVFKNSMIIIYTFVKFILEFVMIIALLRQVSLSESAVN